MEISHTVERADIMGGTPGYRRERKLTSRENKLRDLYVSFNVCDATADELFRVGLDSVDELVKMETF